MNITGLTIGALIGAIVAQIIALLIKTLKEKQKIRKNDKLEQIRGIAKNTPNNTKWILSYYRKNNREGDLYNCRIGRFETEVPFLTKPDWLMFEKLHFNSWSNDDLIIFSEASNRFDIDYNALAKRKELGNVIFPDGPAVYLGRIQKNEDKNISFHVRPCTFYQVLSNISKLEDETFNNIRNNKLKSTPFRDKYIASITSVESLGVKPFGLGCAVLLALKTEDSYELIIHKRAGNIDTYPDAMAVIPNFGLEPVPGYHYKPTRSNELLLYNFLKEYVEEMFNYEDLITQANCKKINPYWFFEHSKEAKNMLTAIDKQSVNMVFLGFGFDCLNGVPILSLLAIIDDYTVINNIKMESELNWEGEKTYVVNLNNEIHTLTHWLKDGKYHPGAAFTISRALSYLKEHNLIQKST